jgi:exodeoxyribonuclease VII large subunit
MTAPQDGAAQSPFALESIRKGTHMVNAHTGVPADRGPAPISDAVEPGPFAVGRYAESLRDKLRGFAHVQLFGEVVNVRATRASVYFELRDRSGGGLPCAMWREAFDKQRVDVADGDQVVVVGGCDYYPGSGQSSPSFSFRATKLRTAGRGDLLVVIEEVRQRLRDGGLFEPQKQLELRGLPRTIGVVTGETGKARDDILAALRRRGWAGRIVWAFTPVQDRHAAKAITEALQDLASLEEIDAIVVARGGGAVMDLMAFSDETLCRTVAMLRVPVIASIGHHTDHTLLDDVAHSSCSTPTHAAEAAVPVAPRDARIEMAALRAVVDAHDPQRTLKRGFALVHTSGGEPVTRAADASHDLRLTFADGSLDVRVDRKGETPNA